MPGRMLKLVRSQSALKDAVFKMFALRLRKASMATMIMLMILCLFPFDQSQRNLLVALLISWSTMTVT